jgi:hypothetical protein
MIDNACVQHPAAESYLGDNLRQVGTHMNTNPLPLIGLLLLLTSLGLQGQSRPDGTIQKTIDYKLGQVWTMDRGITITILAIEDGRKAGKIVHVRVDKIPWQSCGEIHLTRMIEHVAVTEKIMLMSGLVFSQEDVALPQSSIEALRMWQGQKQKKRQIWKAPLPALIQAQGYVPGPISCDSFPRPT